jgi:hypothetical protein
VRPFNSLLMGDSCNRLLDSKIRGGMES